MLRGLDTVPGFNEAVRYDVEDKLDVLNEYLDRIHEYVLHGIGQPFVLDAARKIVSGCDPYDRGCETSSIYSLVLKHFRYAQAPSYYGVEAMQTPEKVLSDIMHYGRCSGECEEMVVLLASLLANLNHRVALVYGGDLTTYGQGRLKAPPRFVNTTLNFWKTKYVPYNGDLFPNYRHVWCADLSPDTGQWVHLDPTGYLDPGKHFRFKVIGWDIIRA